MSQINKITVNGVEYTLSGGSSETKKLAPGDIVYSNNDVLDVMFWEDWLLIKDTAEGELFKSNIRGLIVDENKKTFIRLDCTKNYVLSPKSLNNSQIYLYNSQSQTSYLGGYTLNANLNEKFEYNDGNILKLLFMQFVDSVSAFNPISSLYYSINIIDGTVDFPNTALSKSNYIPAFNEILKLFKTNVDYKIWDRYIELTNIAEGEKIALLSSTAQHIKNDDNIVEQIKGLKINEYLFYNIANSSSVITASLNYINQNGLNNGYNFYSVNGTNETMIYPIFDIL